MTVSPVTGLCVRKATFRYRRRVTITELSGNDLTDYQVLIELDSSNFDFSHTQANGEDIRFADANGNLLPYWIEEWDSVNKNARVWVKIPHIPANSTIEIYMYFGNPTCPSASNPEEVFLFFDDFDELDTDKWEVSGDVSVSNSQVIIGGGTTDSEIKTKTTFTGGHLKIITKINNENKPWWDSPALIKPPKWMTYRRRASEEIVFESSNDGTNVSAFNFPFEPEYFDTIVEVSWIDSGFAYALPRRTLIGGSTKSNVIDPSDDYQLCFRSRDQHPTLRIDYVAVAKCVAPEPRVEVGGLTKWQLDRVPIIIDCDDFSAQTSAAGGDLGGDKDDGVFSYLNNLVAKHPDVIFTLGAVVSMDNEDCVNNDPNTKFKWDALEDTTWVPWLQNKLASGNFVLMYHGYYHWTHWPWNEGDNWGSDWYNVDTVEHALQVFDEIKTVIDNCGLEIEKSFCAPGWYLNSNVELALPQRVYCLREPFSYPTDLKYFEYDTDVSDRTYRHYYYNRATIYEYDTGKIVAIGHFFRVAASNREAIIDLIMKTKSKITIHTHINDNGPCTADDALHNVYSDIDYILSYIEDNYPGEFQYTTYARVGKYELAKAGTEVSFSESEDEVTITFTNNSGVDAEKLTYYLPYDIVSISTSANYGIIDKHRFWVDVPAGASVSVQIRIRR